MAYTVTEHRRAMLLDAIGAELKKLDPIIDSLTGIQITVKFLGRDRRVVITHPELRAESS